MNFSKVKEDIYDLVYSTPKHLTAEQVYLTLHKRNSKIGIATVYRNLSKLVEEGRLQKLTGLGEADRYDGNTKKHFHFYCIKCKQALDLDYPEEKFIDKNIEESSGHKILNHDFVFYGICKNCLKEDKQNEIDEM